MLQDRNWQRNALEQYPGVAAPGEGKNVLAQFERSLRSPGGEDGVLLTLFSRFGAESRTFADLGCANGRDSNCACFLLDFGWTGLMVDANDAAIASAERFFSSEAFEAVERVTLRTACVTPQNVDELLSLACPPKQRLDLLSLDIDGNDYHVFNAVTKAPRIAVLEYNASLGPDRRLTVPYTPNFNRLDHSTGWYHGASLTALHAAAEKKGLALVGCDSMGANAFFVDAAELAQRNDPVIRSLAPSEAWRLNLFRAGKASQSEQWQRLESMPWEEV